MTSTSMAVSTGSPQHDGQNKDIVDDHDKVRDDHRTDKPKRGRLGADPEKTDTDVHLKQQQQRHHQKKSENSKYQNLLLATSTGGETPPFDNRFMGGQKKRESNPLDIPVKLQGRREAHELNRQSAKSHELMDDGGIVDAEDTDVYVDTTNDIESSCSTLTTTRSMMLQQQSQEDVHISVASISSTKTTTRQVTNVVKNQNTPLSILDLGRNAKQKVPIQRTGNIANSIGSNVVATAFQSNDPSPPLSAASAEARSQSPYKKLITSTKNKDITSSNLEKGIQIPISAPRNEEFFSRPPSLRPMRSQGKEKNDGFDVKKRLGKHGVITTTPQEDRIDFFPMHKPQDNEQNGNEDAPRLGASSRFPSLGIQAETRSTSREEECWNPFLNHNNNVNNLSWVTFGDLQSSKEWISSEWEAGESPVSFPSAEVEVFAARDNSIMALLDDHQAGASYDYEKNKENQSHLGNNFQEANQDPRNFRDIRKILARGAGGISGGKLRKRPQQTPKLLGPLLEKRFTRSYWRRLRGAKKQDSQRIDQSSPMDNKTEVASEVQFKTEQHPSTSSPSKNQSPFSGPAGSDSNWWEPAPYDEQKQFEEELQPTHADNKTSPQCSKLPCTSDSTKEILDSKVLSSTRLRECHTVLETINLPLEKLLTAIDTADATSELSKDQILSLRCLIPTREERQLLLRYVKKSRKEASMLEISDRGERFMLQMTGVEKVQRKLAALLFQHEFPGLIQRLHEGYRLLQSACEEILASSKLEKVLGIINMLQNRLVGRTPGQRKTSRISLSLLRQMQAEAESYSVKGADGPFLVYACTRIQGTKPSLLKIKEELPSLQVVAARRVKWESLCSELEALEARFEAFREFAIALCSKVAPGAPINNDKANMSVEDEIDFLQSTKVGTFAVDACLRMAEIYEAFDSTQNSYDALTQYLVEEKDRSDKPSLTSILATIGNFTTFVEKFT